MIEFKLNNSTSTPLYALVNPDAVHFVKRFDAEWTDIFFADENVRVYETYEDVKAALTA